MPSCKELAQTPSTTPNSLACAAIIKRFTFLENCNTGFFHTGF